MIDFGYNVENGKFVIDPVNGKIVEEIHRVFIEENSVYSVLGFLDASEYYSPRGKKKWTRSTVRRILGNEIYKGNDYLPRLLPDEVVDQVNQMFFEKTEHKIPANKESRLYFANIFCDKCGAMLTPSSKNSMIYQCDCTAIPESFIQESFVALANAIYEDPQIIEHYEANEQIPVEIKEMNLKVDKAINDSKYSHFNAMTLLKERAALAYKHSKLNDDEMKSMKILNCLLKEPMNEFDWILYSSTIQKVTVLDRNIIRLELINGQYFEFENEGSQ